MKKKISDYITRFRNNLILSALILVASPVIAQTNTTEQNHKQGVHKAVHAMSQQERLNQRKAETAKKDTLHFPLFGAIYIGADLYNISNHFFGGKFDSYEGSIDINMKNRFFPVFEFGHGKTDYTKNNITYVSSAPYFRIGMNYKFKYKNASESCAFIGFRYGFSKFKYSINGPGLSDGYWGGTTQALNINNLSSTGSWFELVGGVRVQIYKNIMMGWTVRYCTKISANGSINGSPWYIPGYGESKGNVYNFTYSIMYRIPFKNNYENKRKQH